MVDNLREGTDSTAILAVGGSVTGTIDAEPINADGVTPDGSGGFVDKDWYHVTLTKRHIYKFQGSSTSISTGSLAISLYNGKGTVITGPNKGATPSIADDTTNQSNTTQTYYVAAYSVAARPTAGAQVRYACFVEERLCDRCWLLCYCS